MISPVINALKIAVTVVVTIGCLIGISFLLLGLMLLAMYEEIEARIWRKKNGRVSSDFA